MAGWFADVENDRPASALWQPCWLIEPGLCLDLGIYFRTKDECEAFIKTIPKGE